MSTGGGGGDCFCSRQRGGVRKGAVRILLSSSITTNKSPLTRHNGIKPTKGREGVDKRLPAVDTLIPFVVQKRVRRGTSITQRKQLLKQRTVFTTFQHFKTLTAIHPTIWRSSVRLGPSWVELHYGTDYEWSPFFYSQRRNDCACDWRREAGEAAVLVFRDSRFQRSRLAHAYTSLNKFEEKEKV